MGRDKAKGLERSKEQSASVSSSGSFQHQQRQSTAGVGGGGLLASMGALVDPSALPAEAAAAFKKLYKPSAVTRARALDALAGLFASDPRFDDDATADATLRTLAELFPRLAADSDRCVRERAAASLLALLSRSGPRRSLGRNVSALLPAWLMLAADPSREAAARAMQAFALLPPAGRAKAVRASAAPLGALLRTTLQRAANGLPPAAAVLQCADETADAVDRAFVACAGALCIAVETLAQQQQCASSADDGSEDSARALVRSVLPDERAWKSLLGHAKSAAARRAGRTLVISLAPVVACAELSPVVLGTTMCDPAAWPAALAWLRARPEAWGDVNARKAVFPRFFAALRTAGSAHRDCALPLLASVPREMGSASVGFCSEFFAALWAGFANSLREGVSPSVAAADAVAVLGAFCECARHCFAPAASPDVARFVLSPVFESALTALLAEPRIAQEKSGIPGLASALAAKSEGELLLLLQEIIAFAATSGSISQEPFRPRPGATLFVFERSAEAPLTTGEAHLPVLARIVTSTCRNASACVREIVSCAVSAGISRRSHALLEFAALVAGSFQDTPFVADENVIEWLRSSLVDPDSRSLVHQVLKLCALDPGCHKLLIDLVTAPTVPFEHLSTLAKAVLSSRPDCPELLSKVPEIVAGSISSELPHEDRVSAAELLRVSHAHLDKSTLAVLADAVGSALLKRGQSSFVSGVLEIARVLVSSHCTLKLLLGIIAVIGEEDDAVSRAALDAWNAASGFELDANFFAAFFEQPRNLATLDEATKQAAAIIKRVDPLVVLEQHLRPSLSKSKPALAMVLAGFVNADPTLCSRVDWIVSEIFAVEEVSRSIEGVIFRQLSTDKTSADRVWEHCFSSAPSACTRALARIPCSSVVPTKALLRLLASPEGVTVQYDDGVLALFRATIKRISRSSELEGEAGKEALMQFVANPELARLKQRLLADLEPHHLPTEDALRRTLLCVHALLSLAAAYSPEELASLMANCAAFLLPARSLPSALVPAFRLARDVFLKASGCALPPDAVDSLFKGCLFFLQPNSANPEVLDAALDLCVVVSSHGPTVCASADTAEMHAQFRKAAFVATLSLLGRPVGSPQHANRVSAAFEALFDSSDDALMLAAGPEGARLEAELFSALTVCPFPRIQGCIHAFLAAHLSRSAHSATSDGSVTPALSAESMQESSELPPLPPGFSFALFRALCEEASVLGSFLAWDVLHSAFAALPSDSPAQRTAVTAHLRATAGAMDKHLAVLVPLVKKSGKDRPAQEPPTALPSPLEDTEECIRPLAAWLFLRALAHFPVAARAWYVALTDKELRKDAEAYTRCISPRLITAQVGRSSGRAVVSYEHEDITIEAAVVASDIFPLEPLTVEGSRCEGGVSEAQRRKWQLGLVSLLAEEEEAGLPMGIVERAGKRWKRGLDEHFEGIEPCPICYSVFSATNGQLPQLRCRTCKNRFHKACIYKWFATSHNTSCPLCKTDLAARV